MTLTELHDEALKEEDQGIPRYRRRVKEHILDYYNYLDQQPWTESTKNNHIKVIRSFYKHLDIDIPEIRNHYEAKPIPEHNNKNITKPLIRMMIDNATTRDKAILTLAALTGQSPDEIRHITIQQIINTYNTELDTPLFDEYDILQRREEILHLTAPRLDTRQQRHRPCQRRANLYRYECLPTSKRQGRASHLEIIPPVETSKYHNPEISKQYGSEW
jgi:integrase